MGARGRKSGDALTVAAPVGVVQRPDAPACMTPQECDVWEQVVDAMPADWFSPENHPLLEQYCRHVIAARNIAQLIAQATAQKDLDQDNYERLLKMQREQSTVLKTLAASMRLAQQAKYNAQSASTADSRGKMVKRPWEA